MAWASSTCTTCSYSFTFSSLMLLVVLLLGLSSQSCYGLGTLGFDIHHRFSDKIKAILGADGIPEKGSVEYYAAMVGHDRMIRGRYLAANNNPSQLTFANGNETMFLPLNDGYYANVSVGTPSLSFLVLLDTGSALFWLPCGCQKGSAGCEANLTLSSTEVIEFNIYDPNASSTSENVPGNSTLCGVCVQSLICPSSQSTNCPYGIKYGADQIQSTSSGILVEDVLHLITDDDESKSVDTKIAFGCAQYLTPDPSLTSGNLPPNGLLGLGIYNLSVPSTLAKNGLVPDSFSMCFGPDQEYGRITFGDTGNSDQKQAPFTIEPPNQYYYINISQITVGSNVSKLEFSAIFDSGTSITLLNDPAYTIISTSFDSQVKENRSNFPGDLFEYCYYLSNFPKVNLTLKDGDEFLVTDPLVQLSYQGENLYCLGIIRLQSLSEINIIGANFMTGYRIVFNRDQMVLGWKPSNCYNDSNSNASTISPSPSPATSTSSPSLSPGTSPSSHSPKLKAYTYALVMLLVSFFV